MAAIATIKCPLNQRIVDDPLVREEVNTVTRILNKVSMLGIDGFNFLLREHLNTDQPFLSANKSDLVNFRPSDYIGDDAQVDEEEEVADTATKELKTNPHVLKWLNTIRQCYSTAIGSSYNQKVQPILHDSMVKYLTRLNEIRDDFTLPTDTYGLSAFISEIVRIYFLLRFLIFVGDTLLEKWDQLSRR